VKDVGVLIGNMVWEGRQDNLVKAFEAKNYDIDKNKKKK
jgi:hypothetical protein